MKKIIYIAIMLALVSCEKFFHEEKNTLQSIETEEELISAINAAYYWLARATEPEKSMIQIVNADDINYEFSNNVRINYSIDSLGIYFDNDCRRSIMSTLSLDYGAMDFESLNLDLWRELYKTISSVNNIIIQFSDLKLELPNIRELVGEAYFIRGYAYYKLVRIYGEVPIVDNIDVDYAITKGSFQEIYEFIENDIKNAIRYLPATINESRIPYVSPHRGCAKALIAEVYLTMGGFPLKNNKKYTLAAKNAGEVIDSADYFGFGLMENFADLWKVFPGEINLPNGITSYSPNFNSNNKLRYNKESIFATGDNGWNSNGFSTAGFPDEDSAYYTRLMPPYLYTPEVQFYNTFPESYRKDVTYTTNTIIGFLLNANNKYTPLYHHFRTIDPCYAGMQFKKISYRDYDSIGNIEVDIDQDFFDDKYIFRNILSTEYLLRYAHTLLTYAEAKARCGQLDASAYEAVNMIRRRANKADLYSSSIYDLPAGLSPEQFADSVVQERAWEFAGEEEGRWFDLLRLEMVDKLPQLRHPLEGGPPEYPISEDTYFAPIPDEDKWLNLNL